MDVEAQNDIILTVICLLLASGGFLWFLWRNKRAAGQNKISENRERRRRP